MRGTHEHGSSTVIMGGPDKPGHDAESVVRDPLNYANDSVIAE
jgi:hypothetical protein